MIFFFVQSKKKNVMKMELRNNLNSYINKKHRLRLLPERKIVEAESSDVRLLS